MFRDGVINGVSVRQLAKFANARGWLIEPFREDQLEPTSLPVTAYVSQTLPGSVRGPHNTANNRTTSPLSVSATSDCTSEMTAVAMGIAGLPALSTAQSPFLTADQAPARMMEEEAQEAHAYSLGVQAIPWGMQVIKAGAAIRDSAKPLPDGVKRMELDPYPHAYNVWGHARASLTHEIRLIEAPNTETPYSIAALDLNVGPIVLVHPDFKRRLRKGQRLGGGTPFEKGKPRQKEP